MLTPVAGGGGRGAWGCHMHLHPPRIKEGGVKSQKRGISGPKVRWNVQRTPIMRIMLNVGFNVFNDLAQLDLSAK